MRINPVLDALAAYPAERLNEAVDHLRAQGRPVYDFGVGDPVEPVEPFIREALVAGVRDHMPYPRVQGSPQLRAAVAGYLHRRFAVEIDPATQVLPVAGAKEAIFHLPLAVIDREAPDRAVAFPDPGYPGYQRGALFAGAEPVPLPLHDGSRFPIEALTDELLARTRLLWLNSPHNPSGAVLSREELRAIWERCRAHDVLLVNDEPYADLYDDAPPPSLLEVASEGVLVIHSLSKRSGMTGYRAGFLAGDPRWIARLRQLRANPGVVPTDFVNEAATAAWSDDAHAEERRRLFRDKKALFRAFFDEIGLEVVGSEATIYLWVRAPGGDDEDFALALAREGIVVQPGCWFGVTGAGSGFVRLAMVPSLQRCREAIALWRHLVESGALPSSYVPHPDGRNRADPA